MTTGTELPALDIPRGGRRPDDEQFGYGFGRRFPGCRASSGAGRAGHQAWRASSLMACRLGVRAVRPLAGHVGLYAGMKPGERVELLLSLLGGQQRVTLAADAVEAAN